MSNVMLLHGHLTDKELVEKVKAGNKNCFEVLVTRHSAALYRIGRMYGFNHLETETLLVETFHDAYSRLRSFTGSVSYRTWLTRMMIHACLISRKEQDNDHVITIASNEECDTTRMPGRMEPCIEQMPLPLRSVYILVEVDGYSIAETAHLLSTTEDGVRQRLDMAKTSLRKSIRRWFQSTDVYPYDQQSCKALVREVMDGMGQKVNITDKIPNFSILSGSLC